eukprot:11502618-Karenia_brevis.AAC.1
MTSPSLLFYGISSASQGPHVTLHWTGLASLAIRPQCALFCLGICSSGNMRGTSLRSPYAHVDLTI